MPRGTRRHKALGEGGNSRAAGFFFGSNQSCPFYQTPITPGFIRCGLSVDIRWANVYYPYPTRITPRPDLPSYWGLDFSPSSIQWLWAKPPFQRPLKANLIHYGFLGWESGFLCAFSFVCLNVKKWVLLSGLFI